MSSSDPLSEELHTYNFEIPSFGHPNNVDSFTLGGLL